jgi:leucyl-tRNA synthetase
LKQWYFRITDYADRLLEDLGAIDWPESIKVMQRNWIGRSQGVEVIFQANPPAPDGQMTPETAVVFPIPTFTTRLDTLFGVTFLVLAPEHPLTMQLVTEKQRAEVVAYVERAQRMTEVDRLAEDKAKTGVFTGAYAHHPITDEDIPIWVADYVLMGYGSGAVIGVPGHDMRDYAFAKKYDLPIVEVISPEKIELNSDGPYTGPGIMINSGPYSGLTSERGSERLAADLVAKGLGEKKVTYKLRDWLISRQRYWGAPIPIIHCPECGPVAVPDEDLPVLLPDIDDFAPTGDGRSPLARVGEWINTTCPQCGRPAQRETDTMDGFACSSWYYLRFASPHYDEGPFEPEAMNYWLPVDTYVGGAEHAVMHLLYSRFWTKVMYDAGLVSFAEPFTELRNQGVLHADDGQRMSKSRGNVVTPDEVVAAHGTDALRTHILFIGPFEGDVIWDDKNIKGVDRFLERYWKLAWEVARMGPGYGETWRGGDRVLNNAVEKAFYREMHQTIKRVTDDLERFKFNTSVAALMGYLNTLYDNREAEIGLAAWRQAMETFTQLLCPIAPFITEEVWQEALGHKGHSVHQVPWPDYDEALAKAEVITVMVQVNGKLRDRVTVPAGIDEQELRETVLAREKVQKYVNNKLVRKTIVVPQRLINIVVN